MTHDFSELFKQLGLPYSASDIEAFIDKYRPVEPSIELHEANFWNQAQKDFLRQQIDVDADWAETVDQLNVRLR